MTIEALTSAGPSAGVDYAGVLKITFGQDGAVDVGSFTPEGGVSVPVVGKTEGRALSFRVMLANDQALVLTGTGEKDIAACSGALSGVFGGPELGDTGSWLIDPSLSRLTGSSSGGSVPPPPPAGTPSPSPTPSCPGVDCGTYSVVDPSTCECICPDPYETCGPACCPGGSECLDESTGECDCPYNSELCHDLCYEICEPGYHRDYGTCECIEGCGDPEPCPEGETWSDVSCSCESYCNTNSQTPYYCGGTCYEEPYTECNGQCYATAGLESDDTMCGESCQACDGGTTCVYGECTCPSGGTYCDGVGCKTLYDDDNNCGDCGYVCPAGTSCLGGSCEV